MNKSLRTGRRLKSAPPIATPSPTTAAAPAPPVVPQPIRRAKFYAKREPVPADPLDMPKWNQAILAMAIDECIEDENISDFQRRTQIIALARASVAQIPKARLRAAEKAVKEDLDHQAEQPGGELEDAPIQ